MSETIFSRTAILTKLEIEIFLSKQYFKSMVLNEWVHLICNCSDSLSRLHGGIGICVDKT